MREFLEKAYREITEEWGILDSDRAEQAGISMIIKDSLENFTKKCSKPALWGLGEHTDALMSSFIFELKNVKYIISRKQNGSVKGGFQIVGEADVCKYGIDGIIISTFQHRENIKTIIKSNYPQIKYLDIYEEIEKQGIACPGEFYNQSKLSYPWISYGRIGSLVRSLEACTVQAEKAALYEKIIIACVKI